MFKKIFNFVLFACYLTSLTEPSKTIYFKLIKFRGEDGCIQANVTEHIAYRFGAKEGTCIQNGCNVYFGQKYIPFCCMTEGYKCSL